MLLVHQTVVCEYAWMKIYHMRVKETDPVVSADSHYKHAWMEGPARLDIGLEVLVPQFISPGDLIRVNTTNGEYMERV